MEERDSIHLKYLPVSEADQLWGAVVHTAGYLETAPGEDYPPAGLPPRYSFSEGKGRVLQEYQLVYVTEGSGKFTSASLGKWVSVRKGSMFLLFPGEWHTYRPDKDTGWKEYWIGFSGTDIDIRVKDGFFTKDKPVHQIGLREEAVGLYRSAIETASGQKSGFQQLLGGIVLHLLGLAYSYARNEAFRSSNAGVTVSRAKALIDERYKTITAEEVADSLCIGYSSFRKIFKAYTGMPPAKYILGVKMDRTKDLLVTSDLPIRDVALQMGFDNYEYFFTVFKRLTGLTPADYRALIRGTE